LLYALGLRVGEVSRLRRKDVDFDQRLLVIRQTKFGKDRLVPFGPKLTREIASFLSRRDAKGAIPHELPLFSFSKDGQRPIGAKTISWTFHQLVPELGLTIPEGVAPPNLHCLRHSFAVGTLLRWYRIGENPATRLLQLSTFLGHVSPSSTAVYLTITADLLECASQRFAHFAAPAFKELAL
jgi:integrase